MARTSKSKGAGDGHMHMSPTLRPDGMPLIEWQKALRRQAAVRGAFTVSEVSDKWSPGQYNVCSPQSRRTYRTVFFGDGHDSNFCDCPDFRTNNLGTCKHIEAVAQWLEERGQAPARPREGRSALYMSYMGGRHLRLRLAPGAPEDLAMAAMRFFDDDGVAEEGMIAELPTFIEQARRIDNTFHCYPDALNYILERRDHLRRNEYLAAMPADTTDSLLNTTLYPYQSEGIRFAFGAGSVLIADEMGLGKTVQALGTAELMKRAGIVSSVLIVCPTSLKYQWKKEIERFTGSTVTVIEGPHRQRRGLYQEPSFYKIVSYHTLANDIKTTGPLSFDFLIMDEVQRLKNWNTQIAQAAKRINADYRVVLSGTPLENKLDELYSVMQFVDQYALGPYYEFTDRYVELSESGKIRGYHRLNEIGRRLEGCMLRRRKADVALQLPERTDKMLYVPMTREQRAIHDESRAVVARLAHKWQRYRFLSEKDRKRLLLLLGRMRMVCDSTFVLDQKSRNDTKVAEALQLITAMCESGEEKAVIFSQWERMTRLVAEELDRAGIGYEYLHGGVPAARRRQMTESFASDPSKRVFLATDAGSTGLNLQAASLVINLDLPWNPAVLEQRIGRIHRIGQRRNIQVINMVSAGSIEERMLDTLNFKNNLFAGILDGGEDRITLDDSKLTTLAEALTEVLPDEGGDEAVSMVDDIEESAVSTALPSHDEGDTPDTAPADIINAGLTFLQGLARTLASPEATERLVDSIVHTDDATGRTELRIPVDSRSSVSDFLSNCAKLFNR